MSLQEREMALLAQVSMDFSASEDPDLEIDSETPWVPDDEGDSVMQHLLFAAKENMSGVEMLERLAKGAYLISVAGKSDTTWEALEESVRDMWRTAAHFVHRNSHPTAALPKELLEIELDRSMLQQREHENRERYLEGLDPKLRERIARIEKFDEMSRKLEFAHAVNDTAAIADLEQQLRDLVLESHGETTQQQASTSGNESEREGTEGSGSDTDPNGL